MPERTCATDGCDRPAGIKKAGLCHRCYGRGWRERNPDKDRAAKARYNAKRRRRDPPTPKTCKACRREFIPTNHTQVFCPPTDADKARAVAARKRGKRTRAKSRCAKRWENAAHRGTVHHLPDLPPIAPYDCARCGKRCTPGENVAPHAKRFCGEACKKKYHRARGLTAAQHRQRTALRRLARAAEGRGPTAGVWLGYTCVNCGASFLSRRGEARYCTRKCKTSAGRRARRAAGRKRIGLHEIAKRDGWSCRLCGLPVIREATVPDPAAATLDHIVPIALGGLHKRDNLQLAHFICNSRKGDGLNRAIGEQTQLV